MKRISVLLVLCLCVCVSAFSNSGFSFNTDNWVATDALGRRVPDYETVGERRLDKKVGLFYYVWVGKHDHVQNDITKILAANPSNPQWGPVGSYHFWGEPEYGYFLSEDPWVIRRDLQMFANADIDFIFLDVSNAFTYLDVVERICQIAREMRSNGIKAPQICFLTYAVSGRTINSIYDNFYAKKLYPDLWFRWNGKPLILGNPNDAELRPEVKNFFTIKYSWAFTDTKNNPNHWQWLDETPQDYGWSVAKHIPEQITVSTAQHPTTSCGKTFYNGSQQAVNSNYVCADTDKGLRFAEQWERALQVNPQVVMITQWNEWVAYRQINDGSMTTFAGRPAKKGDSFFVDVFSKEFNRDIAPMKGGYTDNYYYQMLSYIRKFKGIDKPEMPVRRDITIDGEFNDWQEVRPIYQDQKGDVTHCNYYGYDMTTLYTNNTGRNDIVESRASISADCVSFYVRTADNLTPYTDPNWMMLFIDTDNNKSTGWEGYDYVVNNGGVSATTTSLKRWNGSSWVQQATIPIAFSGNEMELSVPLNYFTVSDGQYAFNFHWADNPKNLNDISAFFLDGESAPDRRFDYHYACGLIVSEPPCLEWAIKSNTALNKQVHLTFLDKSIGTASVTPSDAGVFPMSDWTVTDGQNLIIAFHANAAGLYKGDVTVAGGGAKCKIPCVGRSLSTVVSPSLDTLKWEIVNGQSLNKSVRINLNGASVANVTTTDVYTFQMSSWTVNNGDELIVCFHAHSPGIHTGAITIYGDGFSHVIPCIGNSVVNFETNQTSLDFGDVLVGSGLNKDISVVLQGLSPANISTTDNSIFMISRTQIANGESVTIGFYPKEQRDYSGTITFSSEGFTRTVSCVGKGTNTVNRMVVDADETRLSLFISAGNLYVRDVSVARIEIYALTGQLMSAVDNCSHISISGLQGVYAVKVTTTDAKVSMQKIIL